MPKQDQKSTIGSINCVWGLVCSLSSLDQQRNNLSLFNVIDQINLPSEVYEQAKKGQPVGVQIPIEVVMLWRRAIDTKIDDRALAFDTQVELIDPNGKSLIKILTKVQFSSFNRINRIRLQGNGIFVTIPGDYVFEVSYKTLEETGFHDIFKIPI